MVACPACSADNAAGSRFCNGCGAPLVAPAAAAREERRTVTILFADLAGFTSRSEVLDPEDVRAFLLPYYEVLSDEVERHGGQVDRFLGDGIMAIFGAPTAHEDDPERAVRAALRIVERVPALGLDLRVRVGVNTGPVLFTAAGDGRDDSVTGDTVNTAARLQALAPMDGIVVGEATWRATSVIFDWEALEPALVKGKAEPIAVFRPLAPRARLGTDLTRTHAGPFVGREADIGLLRSLFDKTAAADTVGLVTVVGEPGIGKSRIVAELFAYVDARPELVTWRQGRCLPYGEGIAFWALGEILKAHAGIFESDPAAVAQEKLEAVLPEGDERPWFRQRLLPLLGIEAATAAEQEELFTAWRRFLEAIAEGGPTVLVFEDLHWADDALLAFLEHLADRADGVPLLIVGTARPELFERHPGFGAGLPNVNRANLAPLTVPETSRLVAGLLGAAVPPELAGPILERSEGNPLYAEEFVRLLRDRDLLIDGDDGVRLRLGADLPLPDSIAALIAARLDTLSPDRKSMLADAAVVGKVFWAGAVAAMGSRDPREVAEALRELSRKELVRSARRSSIEGETEYSFWHILARDVAYESLPRAARADRHVAAARWIEAMAGDRVEDQADVLAHHYATALELRSAAGDRARAAELEVSAFRFLSLAGERALGLNTTAALAALERAMALAPPGHPQRAAALARYGEAARDAGRYKESAAALEEAVALYRAMGAYPKAAEAMGKLAPVLQDFMDPRTWDIAAEALALLEPLGPSQDLVAAHAGMARQHAIFGRLDAAIVSADKAIALAADLGLPRPARAVGYRGLARSTSGDPGGLDDYREAIALATAGGQGLELAILHLNFGYSLRLYEGPQAAAAVTRAGLQGADARGLAYGANLLRLNLLEADLGEFDETLALAEELAPLFQTTSGAIVSMVGLRATEAQIRALRGEAQRTASWLGWLETTARASGDPQVIIDGLASAAQARAALQDFGTARRMLAEVVALPDSRAAHKYSMLLPLMVRIALAVGDEPLARRLAGGFEPRNPYGEHSLAAAAAMLAEARGDLDAARSGYADAAQRWERFGAVPEQAFALLGEGRSLVVLGRLDEAKAPLAEAREIFKRLGAAPALAETDALSAAIR